MTTNDEKMAPPDHAAESLPFDIVLLVNVRDERDEEFVMKLYSDMANDGLLCCIKPSPDGQRKYIGIGASDRLLKAFVDATKMPEKAKASRTVGEVDRIYAQGSRQRILYQILNFRKYGGYQQSVADMVENGLLMDHFVLHDKKKADRLYDSTFKYIFVPSEVYLRHVMQYFGEEVAMFFNFVKTYTWLSFPAALISLFAGIVQVVMHYDSWVLPAYAGFTILWATLCGEYWKRTEKKVAHSIGTLGMDKIAPVRSGYKAKTRPLQWSMEKIRDGERKTCVGTFEIPIQHTYPKRTATGVAKHRITHPVTEVDPFAADADLFDLSFNDLPQNVQERYFPSWKRNIRFLLTLPTLLTLCVAVIVTIYLVDYLRNHWADSATGRLEPKYQAAASIINALVIVLLNKIYPIVAMKLTEWENFRTEGSHDNAYIVKMWAFLFVNSYFPLFVTAFNLRIFKQRAMENKNAEAKLQELFFQVFSIFITHVLVGNIQALVVPMLSGKFAAAMANMVGRLSQTKEERKKAKEAKKREQEEELEEGSAVSSPGSPVEVHPHHANHNEFERQFQMAPNASLNDRYAELAILFGYCTMFATIFPFGIFFFLVNNMIDLRIDVVRMLRIEKRGAARRVESIGYWGYVFQSITMCALVTNALLMCFTSDALVRWYGLRDSSYARLAAFVTIEHISFAVMFALRGMVDDLPPSIKRVHAIEAYKEARAKGYLTYDPISRPAGPAGRTSTEPYGRIEHDAEGRAHYKPTTFSLIKELVKDESYAAKIGGDDKGLRRRGHCYGVLATDYPEPIPLAVDVPDDENQAKQEQEEREAAEDLSSFRGALGIDGAGGGTGEAEFQGVDKVDTGAAQPAQPSSDYSRSHTHQPKAPTHEKVTRQNTK